MKKKRIIISMLTLVMSLTMAAQSTSDVLSGVFTINANGGKVQFSKGNLQYVNGNWQFAAHQYDYIGNNQSDSKKDLFAFNGYSTPDASWFNMSHAQWKYLLATRSVTNTLSDGARYTMATLGNTYKGLIIFPDDYTHPDGTDFVAGTYNSSSNFTANVSLAGWALMESAGCVFLPAAGFYSAPREVFDGFGKAVEINTTTSYSSNDYYTPAFKIDLADCDATSNKNSWMSVRLVQVWIDSNVANLQKDADGYYLIGSVNDWKGFAAIVNNEINTAANARMIADIDLGDDQTYISPTWHGEFSSQHYHGTFDGQGHTLTVHYNSSNKWHTPFSQTSGATIKNLHVAGTIKSTSSEPSHMSGLVSNSAGSDVIQNIWVSADITGGSNAWIECGAFVGCNNCGHTTITDCLFTGSITTTGGNNGCFAGYNQGYQNSTITTNNCLSTGSFNFTSGTVSRGTINNSYVKSYPNSIPAGMQVTDAQLSDGTIATKLQDGRSEVIWVQDPVTNQPMLAIFPAVMLGDVNGDHNIDENDLDVIVKIVMGETPPGIQKQAGDLNNDGKVDAADVVKMVDILNGAGETPQQPENKVVTLTTTVGLSDGATGATTRALTDDGIRTFAEGDMMAVVYKNTSGNTVKAESVALTEDDIAEDGKSATFTVTLNAPDKTQDVTYIYPAAMAKADGSVNYDALLEQDGTLATLASQLDYCTNSGSWNADDLPSLTLENQLAICAYTLKNSTGSSEITNTIMGMTISDGTYNYTVSRSPVDDPIYVAIRPVTNADIEITATDGSTNYIKSLTGKTYAANNGYNISLKMQLTYPIALSNVTSPYIGSVITTDGNVYATVGDAATDGETAVAQIITVAHHLALALEDEGSMEWSEAISACSAKNGTSDAVTGASWRLPSVDDWELMGVTDTNMTLGDLINGFASVGGVNIEAGGYWSSTDNGSEDEDDAWFFDFFTNIWYNYGKNIGRKVRACLDF